MVHVFFAILPLGRRLPQSEFSTVRRFAWLGAGETALQMQKDLSVGFRVQGFRV